MCNVSHSVKTLITSRRTWSREIFVTDVLVTEVLLYFRLSDLQSLVTQLDKPDMVSLVPVDHFNMAVQGLSNLLKSGNQSDARNRSDLSIQTHMRCSDGRESATYSTDLDDAILILPLISDYLRHYTEMIESRFENSAASSTSTSSSSPDSFDTSSESPTGSLGQFLKSSANYANDLESLTIASLHTLHTLLSCVGVRRILLDVEVNQSPKETDVAEIEEVGNTLKCFGRVLKL